MNASRIPHRHALHAPRTGISRRVWGLSAVLLIAACGGSLPPRYVLEQDLGRYAYRRYQKALDVEIALADNAATAHNATYVRSGSPMRIAPATVTQYHHPEGLGPALRKALRAMEGYEYGVVERHGEWLWQLTGEQGDRWLAWVSGAFFVKLGIPEGESEVPGSVLEAYLEQYPSDLDERGRAEAP